VGFRRRDRSELGSAYERFPILRERRGLLAGSLSGGEQQMLALRLGDRAYVMEPRRIVMSGTAYELLRDEGVASTNLGA
jgi:ABC-type branched-subunit amino acid transport system ATPase component